MYEARQNKEKVRRAIIYPVNNKKMRQLIAIGNKANINKDFIQMKAYTYKKPLVGKYIVGNLYHAHFGFDNYQTLNHSVHIYQPGENGRQTNALLTNTVKDIGFGLAQGLSMAVLGGGPGELFTYYNGIEEAGGQEKREISSNSANDKLLVESINEIGPNRKYQIHGYNCQSWLNDVVNRFNTKIHNQNQNTNGVTAPLPPWISRENMMDINTPLLAYYYGRNYPWVNKQKGLEFVRE